MADKLCRFKEITFYTESRTHIVVLFKHSEAFFTNLFWKFRLGERKICPEFSYIQVLFNGKFILYQDKTCLPLLTPF